jgi:hypothetical protein
MEFLRLLEIDRSLVAPRPRNHSCLQTVSGTKKDARARRGRCAEYWRRFSGAAWTQTSGTRRYSCSARKPSSAAVGGRTPSPRRLAAPPPRLPMSRKARRNAAQNAAGRGS